MHHMMEQYCNNNTEPSFLLCILIWFSKFQPIISKYCYYFLPRIPVSTSSSNVRQNQNMERAFSKSNDWVQWLMLTDWLLAPHFKSSSSSSSSFKLFTQQLAMWADKNRNDEWSEICLGEREKSLFKLCLWIERVMAWAWFCKKKTIWHWTNFIVSQIKLKSGFGN